MTGSPVLWLLAWLGAAVGLPFVALAAASPLLQRWFAGSDHPRARDPYFLYGASNLGSFAALLAYPLLVEPRASIPEQARGWSAGFALFSALAVAAGIAGRARAEPDAGPVAAGPMAGSRGRERLLWLALSLVPSSWLLGVTQHISTDIAVFPLLWVVPLALYLLTFVAAFSRAGESIGRGAARLLPWAALGVSLLMLVGEPRPMVPQVLWHLAAFVLAGLACHGRLAALRPGPERLNEYYLVLALGGVVGGAFNSLLAPLAFDGVAEYPLAIVAGCLLVLRAPPRDAGSEPGRSARWRRAALALDFTLPLAIIALYLAVAALAARAGIAGTIEVTAFGETAAPGRRVLLAAVATGIVTALMVGRRLRFALALAALFAIPRLPLGDAPRPLHAERTFFGVYRVTRAGSGDLAHHDLWHGSTLHGRQNLAPAFARIPSTYYAPSGPVGDVLRSLRDRSPGPLRFALVGLGTGSLAAYGRPDWSFDYYEIDPAVVRIASDPTLFRYLGESNSPARFLTGDARLALAREGAERYDAIVLDAFSSDAVPVHLLTREALGLYLERLREGGFLLFHVTNRHFDLEPVLAAAARERGLLASLRSGRRRRAAWWSCGGRRTWARSAPIRAGARRLHRRGSRPGPTLAPTCSACCAGAGADRRSQARWLTKADRVTGPPRLSRTMGCNGPGRPVRSRPTTWYSISTDAGAARGIAHRERWCRGREAEVRWQAQGVRKPGLVIETAQLVAAFAAKSGVQKSSMTAVPARRS